MPVGGAERDQNAPRGSGPSAATSSGASVLPGRSVLQVAQQRHATKGGRPAANPDRSPKASRRCTTDGPRNETTPTITKASHRCTTDGPPAPERGIRSTTVISKPIPVHVTSSARPVTPDIQILELRQREDQVRNDKDTGLRATCLSEISSTPRMVDAHLPRARPARMDPTPAVGPASSHAHTPSACANYLPRIKSLIDLITCPSASIGPGATVSPTSVIRS
jgi:hypothetical protein